MSAALRKIRAEVFERADNACEACGQWVTPETGHLDHMLGRAKAPESVANCWALCVPCDVKRTVNEPSAAHWYARMARHCDRHGYAEVAETLRAKIQALQVKHLAGVEA